VVKVFPQPAQSATAMVTLDGLDAALALLARLRATLGDRLSSFEVINRAQAEIALTYVPGNTLPFQAISPWYVVIEVTDTLTRYSLREALESALAAVLEDGTITDAVVATSEAQTASLWRIRHSVSDGNKRAGFGVTHDTAVPLRAQADFVRGVEQRISSEFPEAKLLMVGHLGDGNIHVIVMLDPARYEPVALKQAAARINAIVDEVTLGLRGTISAEHGIGQVNKQRLLDGRGQRDVALMQRIKAALDPKGLFNPGKLFDPVVGS
jgi:FAD/FMN-containing dehydrogenase